MEIFIVLILGYLKNLIDFVLCETYWYKEVDFVWTDSCQIAFEALKGALTSQPVLRAPVFGNPFVLEVDASNQGGLREYVNFYVFSC